jgi:hypothetical protein
MISVVMLNSKINSANELVLTEIILENTLAEYTPEEAVALLSIFVFVEKTDSVPDIPVKLQAVRLSFEGRRIDCLTIMVDDNGNRDSNPSMPLPVEWRGFKIEKVSLTTTSSQNSNPVWWRLYTNGLGEW